MAIAAQDLADKIRFALDAENADHYGDNEDIIPAINSSVQWLISVINSVLGQKKLGEEIFRELTFARVFRTSSDSRISLEVFPDDPWTILAVYPLPTTGDNDGTYTEPTDKKESAHVTNKYHITSDYSAKRLTIEEWALNKQNPFAAGYAGTAVCDTLKEYAYLSPFDYRSNDSAPQKQEIEVRPAVVNDEVTVFYIKKPTKITALTDSIEFPDSVFSLLFNKALAYIAYKQGDGTNISQISGQDISILLRAIS
tara:strand:- start:6762 stop:7523 length:762 start_codon:yes stop_codon:yes gene_type:complete